MDWSKAVPVIGVIISLIILAFIVGGWFYSYGNLQARVNDLEIGQAEMRQEMRDGFNRIDADLESLEKTLREEIRLSKEEIRLTKSEVIAAIQEHEHDGKGRVVFTRPY